jgi:hypothetical protein
VLVGGALIAPALYSTHIVRCLKEKDEQITLLNRELQHRIKNLFAVVSSIIGQTIRSGIPACELETVITGRIRALATAQAQIGITKGSDLRALVEAVVRAMAPDASRLDIDGPPVSLTSETTTPFALSCTNLGPRREIWRVVLNKGGRFGPVARNQRQANRIYLARKRRDIGSTTGAGRVRN